jgi:copper chaperone
MIKLTIPDMTCSHCAGVVTKAVKSIDSQAKVDVDYATKVVSITSTAPAADISKAIDEAGYPNTSN